MRRRALCAGKLQRHAGVEPGNAVPAARGRWPDGADPIAVARALGPAIHHVHGKDVRLERGVVEVNGLLETKPIDDVAGRAWNYVAVGCGRDLQWWKEFFSVVRMMGYNDWVSLEMEDLTMSVDAGIVSSVQALQQSISQ